MIIDFTKMTIYELFALILATIAILIPVIQWAWKKWIIKPRLSFYPTGQAMLFFNQSGSYIRLNGVLESKNKAITLKKLCLKITRKKDDKKLNLTWSTLISPVNQSIVGGIAQTAQTTEAAHPIRVDADRIVCVFGTPQNGLYKPKSGYGGGIQILRIDGFYVISILIQRMV